MSKRVLAMALAILAFFIFVASPFHQTAEAIAGVDDALIAVIIAALAAMGITFVTTGAFTTSAEFTENLMQEYASAQGTTIEAQLRGARTGTNKLGQLLLNNRFVVYLDGLVRFIKAKFSLVNNSTKVVQVAGYAYGELTVYFADTGSPYDVQYDRLYKYVYYFPKPVLVVFTDSLPGQSGVVNMFAVTNTSGDLTIRKTRNSVQGTQYAEWTLNIEMNQEGTIGGIIVDSSKYWAAIDSYNANGFSVSGLQYNSYQDFAYTLNDTDIAIADQSQIQAYTGVISPPLDSEDYTEGDGAILDLGNEWGLGYDDVTSGVIPNDFSDSLEGEATITYANEEEVQDQVEDTPAQVISQEVGDYQSLGLPNVFPFCIPFDIYAFFECLAAEPEAPSFTWRFYIPGICDEEIEIDLAAFDSAARILRTMELLLFIVGLAFVTREKFLRG